MTSESHKDSNRAMRAFCAVILITVASFLAIAGFGASKESKMSDFITRSHDGHNFIMYRHDSRSGFLHHPDCPCLKKP